MLYKKLVQTIKDNNLNVDLELLELAYDFAKSAHKEAKRKSGEPYINHPVRTAITLAKLKLDQSTIIAGLLHDVPEDTEQTLDDVIHNFGDEIGKLVGGITKLGTVKYRGIERYAENLRKMFIAMAQDIRTIFIKFADRIDNLETLNALPAHKQKRIAEESLQIYAPIANRLGVGIMRGQLEDLSFKYMLPREYKKTENVLKNAQPHREKCLKEVKKHLDNILKENKINALTIHGRAKHLYSLYKKLQRYDNDIQKIYDLVALRVVVKTIQDCYKILGLVHSEYTPLIGRIKDYISQPKPNGYKSLHTTVFAKDGNIIEIQIRTEEMHANAEFGIAAHWFYDENEEHAGWTKDKRLNWVNELATWQREIGEIKDTKKYLESLQIDVFQDRIFVFTPKGDVIDLPVDSTPVDFAYHIHTEVGNTCTAAKVNDKMVPLSYRLQSGDLIEIITNKNRKGPNADWGKFVKTQSARAKIKTHAKEASTWFKFPFTRK